MNDVVEARPMQAVPVPAPPLAPVLSPGYQLVQAAVERGDDLAKIEKLIELAERLDKQAAEKAYVAAITQFKQNPPTIVKRKRVYFEGKSGGITDYMHAELADVCAAAIKGLAEVGISHRWDTKQEGGAIVVTCVLTHALGHSQSTTLQGPPDNSGNKNSIQAVASTVTYLERYTLLAATGLATQGMDDDARGAAAEAVQYITAEQVADLEALVSEVGADRNKFLVYCRVERLEHIEARNYTAVVTALRAKAQAGGKGK